MEREPREKRIKKGHKKDQRNICGLRNVQKEICGRDKDTGYIEGKKTARKR